MKKNNTVKLTVKLYAALAAYKPDWAESPDFAMEVEKGATVEQLVAILKIPEDRIKVISLNSILVKNCAMLAEGDRLILFSTISGG